MILNQSIDFLHFVQKFSSFHSFNYLFLNIELICTQTEIKSGLLTGNYISEDCSCEQKKIRIQQQYNLDDYQYEAVLLASGLIFLASVALSLPI